jgi:AcrR family transcriptional regulator
VVRATPLPPDERRAAIITATVPLLRQRGREISTREIAEAAGIAEGTIFRVFASKEELIDAVIDDAFDPTASYQALAAIDDTLDLDARIRCAVTILQQRLNRVFGLVHVLGFRPPGGEPRRGGADRSLETSALVAVLAPDASRLKVPTDRAATMLSALVLALSHPIMRGDCGTKPQPEPDEITDIFLHGITRSMEGR